MEKNDLPTIPSPRRHPALKIVRIIVMTIVGLIVAVLIAFIFGFLVKILWNWLMPAIFNLPQISYWQAFGLLILAKLLFGSFGSHKDHPHNHHLHKKIDHKWHRMIGIDDSKEWDSKISPEKWAYYHKFWHDEGKNAFEAYIKNQESKKESEE